MYFKKKKIQAFFFFPSSRELQSLRDCLSLAPASFTFELNSQVSYLKADVKMRRVGRDHFSDNLESGHLGLSRL